MFERSDASSAATQLLGSREQSRVSYRFLLKEQPAARWTVASLQLVEALSTPYEATLELVSVDHDDPSSLLGSSCTLQIERAEAKRNLHGIISRVRRDRRTGDAVHVQITVVPALAALAQRSDTRIFGSGTKPVTVPDVLKSVLERALQPYERKVSFTLMRDDYPAREYLTQYHETDLAFVQRLMAEEGIWFFFDHEADAGHETLVLVDFNRGALVPNLSEQGNVVAFEPRHDIHGYWQAITALTRVDHMGSTGVFVQDFNWTNPGLDRRPKKSAPHDVGDASELGARPLYEPWGVTSYDYSGGTQAFRKFDVNAQAQLRWEAEQARAAVVAGEGNVVALCPGQKITIQGHRDGLDGDWLVMSVQAHGTSVQNLELGGHVETEFQSRFTVVPFETAYRPERLPYKPRVEGIVTALVVGPDGKPEAAEDDIHTDEHGRVQVKFPWDRTQPGAADATTSCFLRVAQTWGGSGWGTVFIPRIGMEVIVSFIEGDPDKPLVTGSVYNGMNRTLKPLPADKTKSYIHTRSSPGGDGFNELCFEDKKNQEQIYVHAQKDLTEEVEHDHSLSIGNRRDVTVGANENYTVIGKRTKQVGGDDEQGESITIAGDRDTTITQNETLQVAKAQNHTINGDKTTHVDKSYSVFSTDRYSVSQGPSAEAQLVLNKAIYAETTGTITLTNKGTTIRGTAGGELSIEATSTLTVTVGSSKLQMKKDGTISLVGTKVTVGTQSNTLKIDGSGAKVKGSKVGINS